MILNYIVALVIWGEGGPLPFDSELCEAAIDSAGAPKRATGELLRPGHDQKYFGV